MSRILDFYLNGEYYKNNPTWDVSDTDWKFGKLFNFLKSTLRGSQRTVYEVGCGSGELLKKLAQTWPEHTFIGWDIAPDAKRFWNHNISNLNFELGDFLKNHSAEKKADIVLLIDVLEHLADPGGFLEELSKKCNAVVIHLPLDMTVTNVLFDQRLARLRNSIGHIHYYTKLIAEKLLQESGYEIEVSEYTNAWKDSPHLSLAGKFFRVVRWILHSISPTMNAKLLGGQTLILVAKPRGH